MSRLQNFAIGMVMAALGVAALAQVIPVDHVMKTVTIMAVACLSILGALMFFLFAFSDRS